MVFLWSLSDSKSPQVYSNILSIVADLSNALVWKVSTWTFISMSFSLFSNPSVTIPRQPVLNRINVTLMGFFSVPK